MLLLLISGWLLALLAPGIVRLAPRRAGWILALLPAAQVVYFFNQLDAVSSGQLLRYSRAWVPSLGIEFSFVLDGLSLLFALLISGIGALVLIYGGEYLAGHAHLGRFFVVLLAFMASMLGLVLADNVITLFVFWELTSFTSYFLIGFSHEQERARRAALQALLVTGLGGVALLAGLLLLGQVTGSFELSAMVTKGAEVQSSPFYLPILALVLLGAFAKSAQFPLHFWLPAAMEAPTPVSAYLHSATMVKAGIFLLARLNPALGGTDAWSYALTAVGAVTMVAGAVTAFLKDDLKQILAHSTVSALGTLVLLLGLDTTHSIQAALLFLVVHATYKGALFLIAGIVDHETGLRSVSQLGGLARSMPIVTLCAALAALSMAGMPPMLGFISKELLYEAKLGAPRFPLLVTSIGALANVLIVAVAAIFLLVVFLGRERVWPRKPHDPPFSLWLGAAALSGVGLLVGLFPGLATLWISSAVAAVRPQPTVIPLALWHGLNPVVLLSVAIVLGGAGAFLLRRPLQRALAILGRSANELPECAYEAGLAGINWLAVRQTSFLQSGYLRYYIVTILLAVVTLTGYAFLTRADLNQWNLGPAAQPHEIAVCVVILLGARVAVRSASRLAAVASLGVVGYGVALLYVLFGAPDQAMTQFLVETIIVIVFVLVFYHLPRFATLSSRRTRVRDATLALTAGTLMSALVMAATATQSSRHVSSYFADNSLQAHGRNVVNVILVDFRALDTLGEITVLAVAGIGVFALLKLRSKGERP